MPATSVEQNRSFLLIGAALALPIVVLVVLQVLFALDRERGEIERQTLDRAEQAMALIHARVEADLALMDVLATAEPLDRRAWPAAYERAREVAALNPHWRDVIVSDLDAGTEMFSLRRPYVSAARAAINPAVPQGGAGMWIGAVAREGPGCPCVYLHRPFDAGGGRYMLTVGITPSVYRDILIRYAPPNSVVAVVNGEGNFIARNLDHDARVGTPATSFVRSAVASGARTGIYEGRTWEGFESYTAFARAPRSNWSTHMAISSALIDRPRALSFLAIAVGVLMALALGAALVFFVLRDMARRRDAETRMAQTQKLEAIGQLTGGVAHDFNNLLTVIIGGLNMLLRRIEDPKQRQIAEHMLESAKRGDRLTKQLLAFSRGQRMELAPVDLHILIPGMEELLRRSIEPGMALTFSLNPDARWVRTDSNQLELAILNLVINARDAMPDGGRIEIATRPAAKDHMAEVVVSDSGIGMPKDVLDRALEPFFTTKPAGKGTGLGLSQVFGAARQSGGQVEIESKLGYGTRVRIILPRSAPAAPELSETSAAQPEAPAPAPAATPGQRVLVVDDEPGVRSFMADALRQAGYDAVEAADVGVALRLLESEPPALLLTDYSMPGMNGLELAERARARDQNLRVLIVSGYADAAALEASDARPALLRKPFDESTLLEAVRGVMASS